MTKPGDARGGKAPALSGGLGIRVAEVKILLLRGVNVSGANRLPMPEFRAMLGDLGLKDVGTHIQSGNAVFTDPGVEDLPGKIGAAMLARFGFKPALFILGLKAFNAVLAANPYRKQGQEDGAKVHVFFLAEPARGVDQAALAALKGGEEQFTLTDAALYLHAPGGIGRSVLVDKLGKFIKVPMTARNQRSCESILTMAEAIGTPAQA
jgi:uncharacterized protein (DUF1697 family)